MKNLCFFVFVAGVAGCALIPATEAERAKRVGVLSQITKVSYHRAYDDAAIIAVSVGIVTAAKEYQAQESVADYISEDAEPTPVPMPGNLNLQDGEDRLNSSEQQPDSQETVIFEVVEEVIPVISESGYNPEIPLIPANQLVEPVIEKQPPEAEQEEPNLVSSPTAVQSSMPVIDPSDIDEPVSDPPSDVISPESGSKCANGKCAPTKQAVRYTRRPGIFKRWVIPR
jgi:hypothetical protein